MRYKSRSNTYSNGKVMLKGSTSIVIQLETEEHFAVLTLDVERSEVLNFNIERALFLTIGVIKPVCGIAFFEKMPNTCTYEEMSAQYLKPTEEAYQLLEKKGVIKELKTAPNVYL